MRVGHRIGQPCRLGKRHSTGKPFDSAHRLLERNEILSRMVRPDIGEYLANGFDGKRRIGLGDRPRGRCGVFDEPKRFVRNRELRNERFRGFRGRNRENGGDARSNGDGNRENVIFHSASAQKAVDGEKGSRSGDTGPGGRDRTGSRNRSGGCRDCPSYEQNRPHGQPDLRGIFPNFAQAFGFRNSESVAIPIRFLHGRAIVFLRIPTGNDRPYGIADKRHIFVFYGYASESNRHRYENSGKIMEKTK